MKVRFAPSPTGSLHLGNALAAVANRGFADERGGTMLLRIDDTDPSRTLPGGEEAIMRDLEWLGVHWDEGPVRQSERAERHRLAARRLVEGRRAREEAGAVRFGDLTLLRPDGTPLYHLASVVDDAELDVTHVLRGKEHAANADLHRRLHAALGTEAPEYVQIGLLVGEDGRKLSKREGGATVADMRDAGIPAGALRRYLEELGVPRGDVRLDRARIRRLGVEAIAAMSDEELAARAGAPPALARALRGARDLREARDLAGSILEPGPARLLENARPTLERFRELLERAPGRLDEASARSVVRELKALGGDLRALRLALTGREHGPELWTLLTALRREEVLRRAERALADR